jgi:hypothetical protein
VGYSSLPQHINDVMHVYNSELLLASGWMMTQMGFCIFESFITLLISYGDNAPLLPPLPTTSAYHHRHGPALSTHSQVRVLHNHISENE